MGVSIHRRATAVRDDEQEQQQVCAGSGLAARAGLAMAVPRAASRRLRRERRSLEAFASGLQRQKGNDSRRVGVVEDAHSRSGAVRWCVLRK
jgi:hypothetical protein